MKTKTPIVLLILFLFIMLVLLITTASAREPELLFRSQSILFLGKCCGMVIACLSAVVLLLRATSSEVQSGGLVLLTLPLLAGLAIADLHWSISIGLALVVVALVTQSVLAARPVSGDRTRPRRSGGPSGEPPHIRQGRGSRQ